MAKLVLPLRLRDVFLIWQGAGLSLRTLLLERKVEIDRDQIEKVWFAKMPAFTGLGSRKEKRRIVVTYKFEGYSAEVFFDVDSPAGQVLLNENPDPTPQPFLKMADSIRYSLFSPSAQLMVALLLSVFVIAELPLLKPDHFAGANCAIDCAKKLSRLSRVLLFVVSLQVVAFAMLGVSWAIARRGLREWRWLGAVRTELALLALIHVVIAVQSAQRMTDSNRFTKTVALYSNWSRGEMVYFRGAIQTTAEAAVADRGTSLSSEAPRE